MKKLLLLNLFLLICLILLESCSLLKRTPQLEAQVIELDSLAFTADQVRAKQPIEIAKGVTVTPISRGRAILTQPAKQTGKIKYKNIGNTEITDKSVVKEKNKTKAKDAGVIGNENEVKQSKGIPRFLILIVLAVALYFIARKFFPTARNFF